jgi:hypothetical protein
MKSELNYIIIRWHFIMIDSIAVMEFFIITSFQGVKDAVVYVGFTVGKGEEKRGHTLAKATAQAHRCC